MGRGGGAQRPVLHVNEPKKGGSAQSTGAHARPKPTSLIYRNNYTFLRRRLIYEYFQEYERQKFAKSKYMQKRLERNEPNEQWAGNGNLDLWGPKNCSSPQLARRKSFRHNLQVFLPAHKIFPYICRTMNRSKIYEAYIIKENSLSFSAKGMDSLQRKGFKPPFWFCVCTYVCVYQLTTHTICPVCVYHSFRFPAVLRSRSRRTAIKLHPALITN